MTLENTDVPKPKPDRSVAADDFIRFLQSKTPESVCPACEADEWTLVCPPGDDLNAFRLVTPMNDGPRPATISMLAIYCDNCGYVRTHMAKIVKDWVEENPPNSEPDADEDAEDE